MNNKIIIINGPNLNLLGEREQSQYGSTTFEELKEICLNKSKELGLVADFSQSNIEGEIVGLIQDSRKNFDGIIINAAAFTHTSVAIRGTSQLIASITGYPKPSYKEETIAIELDEYNSHIFVFEIFFLKKIFSLMPNSSINLSVCPPFLTSPITIK